MVLDGPQSLASHDTGRATERIPILCPRRTVFPGRLRAIMDREGADEKPRTTATQSLGIANDRKDQGVAGCSHKTYNEHSRTPGGPLCNWAQLLG